MNDPSISAITGYVPNVTLSGQQEWFRRAAAARDRFVLAICESQDCQRIGHVDSGNVDYISRRAMLNIFIAYPDFRGQGQESAGAEHTREFEFDVLSINRICLRGSPKDVLACCYPFSHLAGANMRAAMVAWASWRTGKAPTGSLSIVPGVVGRKDSCLRRLGKHG